MMKKVYSFAAVAALAAVSSLAAFPEAQMKASIPFAFSTPAGGQLPAGLYQIRQINGVSANPVFLFVNLNTKQSALAQAANTIDRPSKDVAKNAVVLFKCNGDTCGLSGMFAGGARTGAAIRTNIKPIAPATDIAEIRIPLAE